MPIKGLFNNEDNNDDEINKLLKRLKTVEMKTNTLDVQVRRLTKFENEWRADSFSKKHKSKKAPEAKEQESFRQVPYTAMKKRLLPELLASISEQLAPMQQKIDSLENRLTIMEEKNALIQELLENTLQETMQLKNELETVKNPENTARKQTPIVIRELKVERIMLDKYEQNNNFSNLGIKEISGQLNIGATYGNSALPAGIADELIADFKDLEDDIHEAEKESGNEAENDINGKSKTEAPGDSATDAHHDDHHYGRGHSAFFANDKHADHEDDADYTDIPVE